MLSYGNWKKNTDVNKRTFQCEFEFDKNRGTFFFLLKLSYLTFIFPKAPDAVQLLCKCNPCLYKTRLDKCGWKEWHNIMIMTFQKIFSLSFFMFSLFRQFLSLSPSVSFCLSLSLSLCSIDYFLHVSHLSELILPVSYIFYFTLFYVCYTFIHINIPLPRCHYIIHT